MKRIFPILTLAGVLALAACSSATKHEEAPVPPIVGLREASVQFLVDNTRELPLQGSYDWGHTVFRVADLPDIDLTTVDQRIHDALQQTLAAKGFRKTSSDPELLVSYALAVGVGIDEKTINEAHEGTVTAPPTVSKNAGQAIKYRPGTLIIDIVETKTKRLLWRGAIMAEVELGISEPEKQQRCQAVVAELLKNYPKPDKRR